MEEIMEEILEETLEEEEEEEEEEGEVAQLLPARERPKLMRVNCRTLFGLEMCARL
jgi:hypothetical protein